MHPIQCPQCPLKMFKYPTSVRKHFKKFHGDETPYFCKTCTLVFTDQDAVQEHMENEHGIPNVVVVTNIVHQQNGHAAAGGHHAAHAPSHGQSGNGCGTLPGVYKSGITCIVCGETNFESAAALVEHRSETHMYKCPDCDKEYKLTDSLRKHVRITHNENVTMTCCKFCDKVFYDTSLKSGHVSTLHADCSNNASKDTTEQNDMSLNTSSSAASSASADKYRCPQCTQSFYMIDGLRKHARMSHNLSIMSCPDCTMVFTDLTSRNIHMSQGHHHHHEGPHHRVSTSAGNGSLLKINTSGNGVGAPGGNVTPTSASLLKSEVSAVTNEADFVYQCPKCSKGYSIAKSLRKHCRINHNKLSICFCHHCPKVCTIFFLIR